MTTEILETEIKAALNTAFGMNSNLVKHSVSPDLDLSKEMIGVSYRSVAPHFGWYLISTGKQALVTDQEGVDAFNRVLVDPGVISHIFQVNNEKGFYSSKAEDIFS